MPAGPTTLLFVSGQGLLREAFLALIQSTPDLRLVAVECAALDALRVAAERRPDVVLIDADLAEAGIDHLLQALPTLAPRSRPMLLVRHLAPGGAVRAVGRGVRGLVDASTSSATMIKAIRAVMAGEYWISRAVASELARVVADTSAKPPSAQPFNLTAREREVLTRVAEGGTNRDVARTLGLSVDTVKHHLTSIFDKTGVSSRVELVLFAMAQGLITPAERADADVSV